MKAIDLLLMLLTFNILFAILTGLGCFNAGEGVHFDWAVAGIATFVTLMTGAIVASGIAASWVKPIGGTFAIAFAGIWSLNIWMLDSFVHFSNYFSWFGTFMIAIVGLIIGIIGAIELQTGVRL